MNIEELMNRALLKELVDRVAVLGDRKDFHAQVQLFTEDAISDTLTGGEAILKLQGRKEMETAFEGFLSEIETVYHFNGQQVLTVDGEVAQGTCYCLITLIGQEEGKKIKTTIGAVYKDDYIRLGNKWLIAKRIGNFDWQEKREL